MRVKSCAARRIGNPRSMPGERANSLPAGGDPAYLAAIVESMPDGFLALDAEGRCTYVNAAGERLLGRTRDEVLGRPRLEALPDAAFHPDLDRAVSEWAPVESERYDEAR